MTPTRNPKKSYSKLCQEKHNKELRKSPQRRTGKALHHLRNHVEPSIHAMKVRTRSSLPPIHPSLSLDLTWSSQASPRKLEEKENENKKTKWARVPRVGYHAPPQIVYMEAPKRLNYPYLVTRDTSPSRANLEVFRFSSSDGCPATATSLASTQALRSRRVSSTSKHLGACNHGGQTAPWAVRSTQAI
jgi:hypothetical protein